ncbi:unnamed protein product [Litomosoides sigmodontis]|uniref:Translocon-associated protein subunit beta n=1 Tax=Litomosoides sigmodontis TaxID=42156 RepID=A0A3P6VEN2_LITSI|nr:unnamed protein product [Litomosoides sigmodontis]
MVSPNVAVGSILGQDIAQCDCSSCSSKCFTNGGKSEADGSIYITVTSHSLGGNIYVAMSNVNVTSLLGDWLIDLLGMRWNLPTLLMLYINIVYGEDTDMNDSAHIVASKFTLSQYAVEGMDYVIDYRLYNVGDRTALRVTLDDRDGFPTQAFDVIRGLLQVRWERIGPGNNVSHSVVVRPRSVGSFNYLSAQITYYPTEDAKEVRISYTTAPGEGYIYRRKDYDRKFSAKVGVWLVFLMLVAPSTVIPFVLWYKSKAKYDQETPSKKSK